MIRRTSGVGRFNINKFSEVLGLISMEKIISKRDDFILNVLFYFEPVQRFEYMSGRSVLGFQLLHEQGSCAVAGDVCICNKFR